MTEKQIQLAQITATAFEVHNGQKELDALVLSAREQGATWREIASALGITVSVAYRKYASRDN